MTCCPSNRAKNGTLVSREAHHGHPGVFKLLDFWHVSIRILIRKVKLNLHGMFTYVHDVLIISRISRLEWT